MVVVELKLQLEVQNITINAFNVKRYSLYIVCQSADRLLFICTRLTYWVFEYCSRYSLDPQLVLR